MILPATANANHGLCAPCSQGRGKCERCGIAVSSASRDGRFICHECSTKEKIAALPFLDADWQEFEDVDWNRIASNYELLGRDLLRLHAPRQGADPAYGMVFQLSQNGILDIHINTQEGIAGIPAKMRSIANWGKELSDEGWIEKMGLWYTPAWKYDSINCALKSQFAAVEDFHYQLHENLEDPPEEMGLVSKKFDEARLAAIAAIKASPEYAAIPKTVEFRCRSADDDGLDYETKQHLGS
jgi:hypothetical protein